MPVTGGTTDNQCVPNLTNDIHFDYYSLGNQRIDPGSSSVIPNVNINELRDLSCTPPIDLYASSPIMSPLISPAFPHVTTMSSTMDVLLDNPLLDDSELNIDPIPDDAFGAGMHSPDSYTSFEGATNLTTISHWDTKGTHLPLPPPPGEVGLYETSFLSTMVNDKHTDQPEVNGDTSNDPIKYTGKRRLSTDDDDDVHRVTQRRRYNTQVIIEKYSSLLETCHRKMEYSEFVNLLRNTVPLYAVSPLLHHLSR
jgi:hypothetical protein